MILFTYNISSHQLFITKLISIYYLKIFYLKSSPVVSFYTHSTVSQSFHPHNLVDERKSSVQPIYTFFFSLLLRMKVPSHQYTPHHTFFHIITRTLTSIVMHPKTKICT